MTPKQAALLGMLVWGVVGSLLGAWIFPEAPEVALMFAVGASWGHFMNFKERSTHA